MGILIIKRLLKRNDIWNAFCENGLNEEADANENNPLSYIDYIYMMIAGKKKLLPKEMDSLWGAVPNNRKWLLQIVSNDKWSLFSPLILGMVLIWIESTICFEIVTT